MTPAERERDQRSYWGNRPAKLAVACVEHAKSHGLELVLRPDTPVIPMEDFPFDRYTPVLTGRTTWADIDSFVRRLGDVGCGWVNLRFAIESDGRAIVRYEAKPAGEPLPDGGIPGSNGGFDCRRYMSTEEFERLHRPLP